MMKKLIIALGVLVLSNSALAMSTGWRTIERMGCHNTDGTCYVYISGGSVGHDSCTATSIRWNKEHDANGDATFVLLSAAFMSSKRVDFRLSDNCYTHQAGYPTISYFNIEK